MFPYFEYPVPGPFPYPGLRSYSPSHIPPEWPLPPPPVGNARALIRPTGEIRYRSRVYKEPETFHEAKLKQVAAEVYMRYEIDPNLSLKFGKFFSAFCDVCDLVGLIAPSLNEAKYLFERYDSKNTGRIGYWRFLRCIKEQFSFRGEPALLNK